MNVYTLEYDGRRYTGFTLEELTAASLPQSVIDAAVAAERLEEIKAECRRRIYAAASSEAQMNLSAAVAVISGKAAASRTDAEKAILAAAEVAIGWVSAMRTTIVALAVDTTVDFRADASWPAVPQEVVDVVAGF